MSEGSKNGLVAAAVVVLVGLCGYVVWSTFGEEEVPADTRTLMDAESGELFDFPVDENYGPFPMENPKTGKKTLFPTEVCYNGPCLEKGGTHVIMNEFLEKEGPTYCPVCGHRVRFHNPGPPMPGRR